ncbi:hypothetical protein CRE_21635 [Caenorhabditis remanei]|uniref:SH2 domain-containing protein n=1 Tax=Caenorhabditis remanei TaxID=31234 RepID=E3NQ68_CAERE|nr:hypothetical protein CRE_21635 [Caenorhabditis remanei]
MKTNSTSVTLISCAVLNTTSRSGEASSAYIGVLTLAEAENRLTNRGEFALYHLSHPAGRLDTLYESLPLMLIYRTTTKKNRHYSIRVSSENQFFVDCGYPNVRKHYSLNQLIMYYKVSSKFSENLKSSTIFRSLPRVKSTQMTLLLTRFPGGSSRENF